MEKINYIKRDLLEAPQKLIIHQCNAQNVMGSGVAKAIRDKYPHVYEEYRTKFEFIPKAKRMGLVQVVEIDNGRSICNLIGQYHYLPRTIRHTSYDALTQGFEQIKRDYPKEDVALPKIGCGLGGGNWKIVSAILESVFDDRNIYVYEL